MLTLESVFQNKTKFVKFFLNISTIPLQTDNKSMICQSDVLQNEVLSLTSFCNTHHNKS